MHKVFRSQAEKYEIATEIASLIPVGSPFAISVNKLAAALQEKYRGDKSPQAFNKEIARLCEKLFADHYDDECHEGLCRLASAGTPTRYYWQDKASKMQCLEQFTITRPRALALLLARQHVSALMPTDYLSALDEDLQKAKAKLNDDGVSLTEVLEYCPYGVVFNQHNAGLIEFEQDIFEQVLDSLLARNVIEIQYNSIHASYQHDRLTLSPIKLRYTANQLQLLAFVHQTGLIKHFALHKITHASPASEHDYQHVEMDKFTQQHVLKVNCHTWVKEQLFGLVLGEQWREKQLGHDVWQLEARVAFPCHFESRHADGFYLANFLSGFADAIEVLEPEFLRNEMARRASKQALLYSGEGDNHGILSDSPHAIVRLATKLDT